MKKRCKEITIQMKNGKEYSYVNYTNNSSETEDSEDTYIFDYLNENDCAFLRATIKSISSEVPCLYHSDKFIELPWDYDDKNCVFSLFFFAHGKNKVLRLMYKDIQSFTIKRYWSND